MDCPLCHLEVEFGTANAYARCSKCLSLFLNLNDALTPYPVDDSIRSVIERSLGFAPSRVESFDAPTSCAECQGALERVQKDVGTFTRCPRCGLLSRLAGRRLLPVLIQSPDGAWDAEFQALFEEELGFAKRLHRKPARRRQLPSARRRGQSVQVATARGAISAGPTITRRGPAQKT